MSTAAVKPLLEAEAREHSLANLKRGSKSPSATVVAVGENGLKRANDLAGATVGVSGKAVERAGRPVHVAELLARDPLVAEARRRRARRGRR